MRHFRLDRVIGPLVWGLLPLIAAAGCLSYHPQPLDTAAHPAEYRARRLDDTLVRNYLQRVVGTVPSNQWDDVQLALSALLFRPELASARARWHAAQASEITAGARPPVGFQADLERAVSGTGGSSPWVVSLAGLFTVELGGKRGARLLRARASATVAESELRGTTWRIVQDVRVAAAAVQLAQRAADHLAAELAALQGVRDLEQERFAEATLTSSELARTASEVQGARAELVAAQRRQISARAELARAVGVPPPILRALPLRSPVPVGCALLDSLTSDSLEHLALHNRPEISRALAQYAEAEADLQLEVARQYPNLELGPGFIWDQGVNRWTLALALPALLGRVNRGPIREAEARRAVVAQQVYEAQEIVLGQLGAAAEGCRGARLERGAADSGLTTAERSAQLARAAYLRGETGRTDLARSELVLQRARRALSEAEGGELLTGLALESAAGEWHTRETVRWPDPREAPIDWRSHP